MPTRYALSHLTILTGDRDGTALADHAIIVDGNTIEAVLPSAELPSGLHTIDLTGHHALPGLINAHAHFFSEGKPLPAAYTSPAAEKVITRLFHSPVGRIMMTGKTRKNVVTQLHSGVTTVRSLGDIGYEVAAVRDEVATGKLTGPTILASGPLLAATGGHGAPQIALTADDPWGARANARRNISHGVDVLKIAATGGVTDARTIGEAGRAQLTADEMGAICEEAHNAGMVVAAHVQGHVGLMAALQAGVDTIEHGCRLTPESVALFHDNPKALFGHSTMVPTLCAAMPFVAMDQATTGVSDVAVANAEIIFAGMVDGLRDALEHEVALGIGTDAAMTYVTHYDFWREMEAWTIYSDMTPAQVLTVATRGNAEMLGLERKGRVEAGCDADLVVVKDSPLDGFRALVDPRMVIARGTILDNPSVDRFAEIDTELDAMFERVRTQQGR